MTPRNILDVRHFSVRNSDFQVPMAFLKEDIKGGKTYDSTFMIVKRGNGKSPCFKGGFFIGKLGDFFMAMFEYRGGCYFCLSL